MRLTGKIGIVTAAASGMGRAGALRFAAEGARVAVVDVDSAGVERVVGEITAAGGTAHGVVADLTKDEDSRRIVWDTVARFKGLDFVWNHVGHVSYVPPATIMNSGILGAGTDQRDIRETSETSQRVSDTASTGQVPYNSVSVRIIFPRPRIDIRSASSGQDQK